MRIPDLSEARALAARPDRPFAERALAADVLVAHGDLDRAEPLIAELAASARGDPVVGSLARAAAQLRRLDVPGRLVGDPAMTAHLSGDYEMVVAGHQRARRTILVCTDITQRCWLSLPVLHLFLEPFEARVVYLRDARNEMFVTGLQGFGTTYAATADGLARFVGRNHGPVTVIACSGGGYFGLRLAVDLKARSFLGFSVRTDLSAGSTLPINGASARLRAQGLDRGSGAGADALFDLRPVLAASTHPAAIDLYHGEGNRVDRAQAGHLGCVGRVRLHPLPTRSHNSVQHLVSEGAFAAALETHIASVEAAPPPWRPAHLAW